MTPKKISKEFFARDTQLVAQQLLGKILVRQWHGQKISGRITEVESYVGEDDLACHAARGRTTRTEVMYGIAGHTYIYLIYGMYHCLNFVTEQRGFPAAVLIRSLEPLEGISVMAQARDTTNRTKLTTGPGKLTQALHITRTLNDIDISSSDELSIVDDGYVVTKKMLAQSPRIGVAYAGACALYPWRYYLKDSLYLSR